MSGLRDKLIVALDRPDLASAMAQVDRIGDAVAWYKVGLELFYAAGRPSIQALADRGKRVFLDLKLHDIPATVGKAIGALQGLPISLLNVHAAGGPAMLRSAVEAARTLEKRPRVLGVTMLTSLDGSELPTLWNPTTDRPTARRRLTLSAGCDGVIASPLELLPLRREHAPPFVILTPGIRGPEDRAQDQKRTLSLPEAIARGADYVVVGRPISEASDPRAVVAAYEASLASHRSSERTQA